jgi:hypothetical protein
MGEVRIFPQCASDELEQPGSYYATVVPEIGDRVEIELV